MAVARSSTSPGLYLLDAFGIDGNNVRTDRSRACAVEIVAKHTDVAASLDLQPPASDGRSVVARGIVTNTVDSLAVAGVPWRFERVTGDNRIEVARGLTGPLQPGGTASVDQVVQLGNRPAALNDGPQIVFLVDPDGLLRERADKRGNNIASARVAPPPPLPPPPPPPYPCGRDEDVVDDAPRRACIAVPRCDTPFRRMSTVCRPFRCASDAECQAGSVCPGSGRRALICTPGRRIAN